MFRLSNSNWHASTVSLVCLSDRDNVFYCDISAWHCTEPAQVFTVTEYTAFSYMGMMQFQLLPHIRLVQIQSLTTKGCAWGFKARAISRHTHRHGSQVSTPKSKLCRNNRSKIIK